MTEPTPSPPPRPGPRPLPLHLATAISLLQTSLVALPIVRRASWPWSPSLRDNASQLAAACASLPLEILTRAVGQEAAQRFEGMLRGIAAYRAHPYRRDLDPPAPALTLGTTRLLDYGGDGRPVLFIPSLVNRAYVLDLSPRRSLLRWLKGQGFRPYLIDWDAPGPGERRFDIAAYVKDRILPALDCLTARHGGPVPVVGYCMGGDLALAATIWRPEAVSRLALLATPWDFHAEGGEGRGRVLSAGREGLIAALGMLGEMPVDVLQGFFLNLDPALSLRKFFAFAALDPSSEAAIDFVALEDWLNDGIPLAAKVAVECLCDWYGDNVTGRGRWRVGGRRIDPAALTCPLWLAVPANDRIVPPGSAHALHAAAGQGTVWTPPLGHIGMVVGGKAETALWRPLAAFLDGGSTALSSGSLQTVAAATKRLSVAPARRNRRSAKNKGLV